MKNTTLSVLASLMLAAIWSSSPASAVEIRNSQQLYTVTPAMMSAINVIVREEMRMRNHRTPRN